MKYKKILAGLLSAAMVLTGIPASGLALQAQAADEVVAIADDAEAQSESETEISSLSLELTQVPVAGLSASDVQVTSQTVGVIAGGASATAVNAAYAITDGSNPFLVSFKYKMSDSSAVPSSGTNTQIFCFGSGSTGGGILSINQSQLLYWCQGSGSNEWPQTQYAWGSNDNMTLAQFADGKWHDIVLGFNGTALCLWVDGGVGTPVSGRPSSYALCTGTSTSVTFPEISGAQVADVAVYVNGASDVNGNTLSLENTLFSSTSAADLLTSLSDLTPTGTSAANNITWTQNGAEASYFLAGNYTGTVTLEALDGYTFASNAVLVADEAETMQGVSANVSEDGSTMTVTIPVTIENDDTNFYKETDFWDLMKAAGTLSDQTDNDIWLYQIKKNGLWSNLPSSAYDDTYAPTTDADSVGKWMDDASGTNTYYYGKLSRDEITSTVSSQEAVGFAWKASEAGYYKVTLEEAMTNTGNSTLDLEVTHTKYSTADGETLLETTLGNGQNFVSEIAKVAVGDYLRIAANKKDAWAQNFKPLIVKCTAAEYAAQYVREVEAILAKNPYNETSKTSVTTAKEALASTISSDSASTDEQIETAIAALEEEIKSATVTMSRIYREPSVGSIDMTEDDDVFYSIANAFSVDIVFKFNTAPKRGTTAYPLFTLSDGDGHYLTVWYNPLNSSNSGRISITGDGVADALTFQNASWKTEDSAWHKITVSLNKGTGTAVTGRFLDIEMDGTNYRYVFGNDVVAKWWTPMVKYIENHDWPVSEILVGKKATNGTYTNPGTDALISDISSDEMMEIKYIEVSSNHYQGNASTGTNRVTTTNSKEDTKIASALTALLNTETAASRTESLYTTDSWSTYNTRKTAADALKESGTDYARLNAMDALETAIAGLTKNESVITGANVTLDGNIGLNLYTSKDESMTVECTKNDGTKVTATEHTYTTEDGESSTSAKYYTLELPAKEMADTVHVKMRNSNDEVIDEVSYSIKEYAENLLSSSQSEYLTALLKSMLNYGAAAQVQFNHNTDAPANASLSADDQAVTAIGDSLDGTCENQGITVSDDSYKGLSLVLKSETALKLYFAADTNVTIAKDGTTVEAATLSDTSEIAYKIENIPAHELGDAYTVSIGGNEVGTVSAMTYCYKVSKSESTSDTLKNLANALYGYYTAAKNYQDSLASATE